MSGNTLLSSAALTRSERLHAVKKPEQPSFNRSACNYLTKGSRDINKEMEGSRVTEDMMKDIRTGRLSKIIQCR